MRYIVVAAIVASAALSTKAFADTITGKVVDTAGKPIAGAKVFISRWSPAPENKTKFIKTLSSDATGSFTVDVEGTIAKGPDGKPLPQYFGEATVIADGFGLTQERLKVGGNIFTLEKVLPIHGKVIDANGKPVANTRVQLGWLRKPHQKQDPSQMSSEQFISMWDETEKSGDALFSTMTATDGSFVLNIVPVGTDQGGVLLTAPEFALSSQPFNKDGTIATPLTAKPSPVVTGRVIDTAGKPLEGMTVSLFNAGGSGKTAADGTYRITHLIPTTTMIMVLDGKADEGTGLTAPVQKNIVLAEGKTTIVPDFVMTKGGVLDITVVDDESGKPLSCPVIISSPDWPTTPTTGARAYNVTEGHLKKTVAAGACQVQMLDLPDYPDRGGAMPQNMVVKSGETVPVTFRLKRGLSAEGVVVGEDDKPIAGVHLRILKEWENYEYEREPGVPTTADGKFKLSSITRDLERGKIFVDDTYTVVSPEKLDLATLTSGPLTVKVKKTEGRPISGRIMSTDGTPISGGSVNVNAYLRTPDGNITDNFNKNVMTDAGGRYSVNNIRQKAIVHVQPYFNNYRYLSGGVISDQPDGLRVSDIVLTPRTVKVNGRVLNAAGKPVAGAYVWAKEGQPETHITSDALGKFTIDRLPADGDITITAAKGRLKSLFPLKMKGGKPTTGSLTDIVLSLESDSGNGEESSIRTLLDTVKRDGTAHPEWQYELNQVARLLGRLNPDLAVQWRTDSSGRLTDENRYSIVEAASRHNLDVAATWGVAQVDKMTDANWKCCAESELAILLAMKQPQLANRLYDLAIAHLKESDSHDVFNYARLAAASALLRRGDEESLCAKMKEVEPDEWQRSRAIGVVARGDWVRAQKLADELKPESRPYAYSGIIREVVKISPISAKELFSSLQKFVKPDDYGGMMEVYQTARRVIRAIGPTDPEAALEIARSLPKNENFRGQRPLVLATAAVYLKGDAATKIWREQASELEEARYSDTPGRLVELARVCQAYGGSPEIVRELKGRAIALAETPAFSYSDEAFVFNMGFFEPPLACRAAEQTLDSQNNAPPANRQPFTAASIAAALATSDPQYAVQISNQVEDEPDEYGATGKGSARFGSRASILKFLLLAPKERLQMVYEDRYTNDAYNFD